MLGLAALRFLLAWLLDSSWAIWGGGGGLNSWDVNAARILAEIWQECKNYSNQPGSQTKQATKPSQTPIQLNFFLNPDQTPKKKSQS